MGTGVLKEQTEADRQRIKETIKRLQDEAKLRDQGWRGSPTFMEHRFDERKPNGK